jgi:hypothetical protein
MTNGDSIIRRTRYCQAEVVHKERHFDAPSKPSKSDIESAVLCPTGVLLWHWIEFDAISSPCEFSYSSETLLRSTNLRVTLDCTGLDEHDPFCYTGPTPPSTLLSLHFATYKLIFRDQCRQPLCSNVIFTLPLITVASPALVERSQLAWRSCRRIQQRRYMYPRGISSFHLGLLKTSHG